MMQHQRKMAWITATAWFVACSVLQIHPVVSFVIHGRPYCRNIERAPVPKSPSTTCHYMSATTERIREERPTTSSGVLPWKDTVTVAQHMILCIVFSVLTCNYQDFDCSHLKPLGALRPSAIYGMGYGQSERLNEVSNWRPEEHYALKHIPSYNEVMQHHRQDRISMWETTRAFSRAASRDESSIQGAVQSLNKALDATLTLKKMSKDYQWNQMQSLIRQPVLTSDLETACSTLRNSLPSPEERAEIGFDWGSCAWRHCGAQADAQEALAELYNLVGVLEPFECQFCLDVVERSIRDMLAVVPHNFKVGIEIKPYQPYKVYEPMRETNVLDVAIDDVGESSLDSDYVDALAELRNRY